MAEINAEGGYIRSRQAAWPRGMQSDDYFGRSELHSQAMPILESTTYIVDTHSEEDFARTVEIVEQRIAKARGAGKNVRYFVILYRNESGPLTNRRIKEEVFLSVGE